MSILTTSIQHFTNKGSSECNKARKRNKRNQVERKKQNCIHNLIVYVENTMESIKKLLR